MATIANSTVVAPLRDLHRVHELADERLAICHGPKVIILI